MYLYNIWDQSAEKRKNFVGNKEKSDGLICDIHPLMNGGQSSMDDKKTGGNINVLV